MSVRILIALFACCLALAACNQNKSDAPAESEPAAAEATEADESASAEQTDEESSESAPTPEQLKKEQPPSPGEIKAKAVNKRIEQQARERLSDLQAKRTAQPEKAEQEQEEKQDDKTQ